MQIASHSKMLGSIESWRVEEWSYKSIWSYRSLSWRHLGLFPSSSSAPLTFSFSIWQNAAWSYGLCSSMQSMTPNPRDKIWKIHSICIHWWGWWEGKGGNGKYLRRGVGGGGRYVCFDDRCKLLLLFSARLNPIKNSDTLETFL